MVRYAELFAWLVFLKYLILIEECEGKTPKFGETLTTLLKMTTPHGSNFTATCQNNNISSWDSASTTKSCYCGFNLNLLTHTDGNYASTM